MEQLPRAQVPGCYCSSDLPGRPRSPPQPRTGFAPQPVTCVCSIPFSSYEVRESAGSVSVAVRRVGNLNRYSIVLCRTEQGTATAGAASRPGEQDYVEYAGQVGGPDHTCLTQSLEERTDKKC